MFWTITLPLPVMLPVDVNVYCPPPHCRVDLPLSRKSPLLTPLLRLSTACCCKSTVPVLSKNTGIDICAEDKTRNVPAFSNRAEISPDHEKPFCTAKVAPGRLRNTAVPLALTPAPARTASPTFSRV